MEDNKIVKKHMSHLASSPWAPDCFSDVEGVAVAVAIKLSHAANVAVANVAVDAVVPEP